MLFKDLNLVPDLQKSIDDIGFTECTDVQEETFSHTLKGHDLLAQSQTGTGKTAAFLISIFQTIETSEYRERAIIVVPTRELASQIEAEARELSLHLYYNIVALYGGTGYEKQINALKNDAEIVVGTPGRIMDLCNKRHLNLKKFTIAVLDEADRMLDMGFVDDIRKIFRKMPNKYTRQTLLFSATLPFQVKLLAQSFMDEPKEVAIAPETVTVDAITQKIFHVGYREKVPLLLGILKKYNAPNVLIFSNMKRYCEELSERLKMNGIKAEYLTGDLSQNRRERTIKKFKERKIPVLIATDVAARGIHIDDLELVINYDIPQHAENYVHRIGRTARAGKSGNAITFACEEFVEYLEPIEKLIGKKIPFEFPEPDALIEDKSAGKKIARKRRASGGGRPNSRGGSSRGRRSGGNNRRGR